LITIGAEDTISCPFDLKNSKKDCLSSCAFIRKNHCIM
jgi:hypothetical protein